MLKKHIVMVLPLLMKLISSTVVTRERYFKEIQKPGDTGLRESNGDLVSTEYFHYCAFGESCNHLAYSAANGKYVETTNNGELEQGAGSTESWVKMAPQNIAYKMPSTLSKIHSVHGNPMVASYGNDGNTTDKWEGCSFAYETPDPWWQVDLIKHAIVKVIRIKTGSWNTHYINPFSVSVGNNNMDAGINNPLCIKDGELNGTEMKTFYCPDGLIGRYVTVFLRRAQYLQVCELEVYEEIDSN